MYKIAKITTAKKMPDPVLHINRRPVSQREFEHLRDELERHGIGTKTFFQDGNVTSEEIVRMLDNNANGSLELNDLQRDFTATHEGGIPTFRSLEETLARHSFRLHEHLKEVKPALSRLSSAINRLSNLYSEQYILLRDDRAAFQAFLRQWAPDIPEALWHSQDFVLEAVKICTLVLQAADEELLKDRQFVLGLVKVDSQALWYVDMSLRDDPDVVMTALQHWGSLSAASDRLRNDLELALFAIEQDDYNYHFVGDSLSSDLRFWAEAVVRNHKIMRALAERENDPELAQRIWSLSMDLLRQKGCPLPKRLQRSYEDFCKGVGVFSGFPFPESKNGSYFFESLLTAATFIQQRQALRAKRDTRPITLIIVTRNDQEIFWAVVKQVLKELMRSQRFHVLLEFAGSERKMKKIGRKILAGGRKIHSLIMMGHSGPYDINLGDYTALLPSRYQKKFQVISDGRHEIIPVIDTEGPEKRAVDKAVDLTSFDIDDLKTGEFDFLEDLMDPNGQILLYGCNLGKGGDRAENLANEMARLVQTGIFAPNGVPLGIKTFEVNPDLSFNVQFGDVQVYRIPRRP